MVKHPHTDRSVFFSHKITIYNFVMTMFIVVYHWQNFYQLNGVQTPLTSAISGFFDVAGYIAMGIFFMMSGFLLYYGAENPAQLRRKMKKRLYTLGVPLLIWNTLALLFQVLVALITDNDPGLTLGRVIEGYTLRMFNGPLWYCLALLLLLILAPVVMRLRRFRYGPIFVLAVALVLSYLSLFLERWLPDVPYIDWFARFIQYWFSYFLGAYVALRHTDIGIGEFRAPAISVIAAIFTGVLVLYASLCGMPENITLLWLLRRPLPIAAWLAIPVSRFDREPAPCIRISFFIYALHYTFIIATMHMVLLPLLQRLQLPAVPLVVIHLILIAALYGICLVVVWLLRRLLPPKWFAALSGGRA